MIRTIDLNADMGESFGPWHMGQDEALLELVTSANIACGYHAGDPDVMAETVRRAARHGVAIGAHPSLPDRQGFGRRTMSVSAKEVYNLVLYQIGALAAFARAAGTRLVHVKPHGALYHQAANDPALASAVADAVRAFDPTLILIGPGRSELIEAGQAAGLRVAREGFADRRYHADGTLIPRHDPRALIGDPAEGVSQTLRLIEQGEILAVDGTVIPMDVDTICLHGDRPEAIAFARELRKALTTRGIVLAPPARHP